MNVNQNFDANNQKIQNKMTGSNYFFPKLFNTTYYVYMVIAYSRIFHLHLQFEYVLSDNCRLFTVQHHSPCIQLVVQSAACFVHLILVQLVPLESVVSEGDSFPGLQFLLEEFQGKRF